jgi:prevent-host-death family protein
MPPDQITATAGDLAREFGRYSDVALHQPVVVTRDGKPCNVLISVAEYERLKQRDQQAFLAVDTPEEFLADLMRFAGTGE